MNRFLRRGANTIEDLPLNKKRGGLMAQSPVETGLADVACPNLSVLFAPVCPLLPREYSKLLISAKVVHTLRA
jgi:hypothetical protein